jgi:hypothetical protein
LLAEMYSAWSPSIRRLTSIGPRSAGMLKKPLRSSDLGTKLANAVEMIAAEAWL